MTTEPEPAQPDAPTAAGGMPAGRSVGSPDVTALDLAHDAPAAPASDGRAERFAALVEPEVEAMLRVAHRLTGSWADAEDVVQDSLVRAYRALDGFDGRHPRAWLFTIVRRTHLNSLRRTRPDLADPTDASPGAALETARPAFGRPVAPSPEQLVDDAALDADLERALAALDERFRTVVLLVDVDRLTAAEAGEVLGVPTGTVVSRLSRGRRRLREALAHRRPGGAR